MPTALAPLALLLLVVGCKEGLFAPKQPPVKVDPLGVEIQCAHLKGGAELALLPDQQPVALSLRVTFDAFDATPEVIRRESVYRWGAVALSACEEATGEFDPPGGLTTAWKVPSGGGFFRVFCYVRRPYTVPKGSGFAGTAKRIDSNTLVLSGTAELTIEVPTPGDRMVDGVLDGVPLGRYPDPTADDAKPIVRKHVEMYRPPAWFYRVDASNRSLRVSPHFTLGDFDITYEYWRPDYPVEHEYIALHPRLIEKVEMLAERLREKVGPQARVVLLAGFRSPKYNQEVKMAEADFTQTTRFSMHLYGRAADFIVDADEDGRMDDLNGDGNIDIDDARVVRAIIDDIDAAAAPGPDSLLGGCGVYPRHDIAARKIQSPYVHVDVRGYLNDFGKPPRWEMP